MDELVHSISENSFDEIVRDTSNKISSFITWTSAAKILKIREEAISRDSQKRVSSIITKQYDSVGALVEEMTETITRNTQGSIESVTRSVTVF